MDILDILLDILLKPPQPFIGLFLISPKIIVSYVFNNFVTPSVWEHVDGSSAVEARFSQKSAGA